MANTIGNTDNPYTPDQYIRYHIAEQYLNGGPDQDLAFTALKDTLGAWEHWKVKEKPAGSSKRIERKARNAQERLAELKAQIRRTFGQLERDGFVPRETPVVEPPEKPVPKKPKATPVQPVSDKQRLMDGVRAARRYCDSRVQGGLVLDSIGMRPVEYGKKMLEQGFSVDFCLYAMSLHWSEEDRENAGMPRNFDQTTEIRQVYDGLHEKYDLAMRHAIARVPQMYVGPSGSGKSHLARDVSKGLSELWKREVSYAECPMTAGATPSWLLGKQKLSLTTPSILQIIASWPKMDTKVKKVVQKLLEDGEEQFIKAEFTEIYKHGGVFCFEEMDAADPNMLLVVNNALATGWLFNPVTGEKIQQHEDFIPICTTNTFGLGANRLHTGRERLDHASLDRWRMGRLEIPFDERLEEWILFHDDPAWQKQHKAERKAA